MLMTSLKQTDLNIPMVLSDPIEHFSARKEQEIELAIVHSMGERIAHEGKIYEAPAWLRRLKLSVHAMIRPDGTVIESVPLAQTAWHAKEYNTQSIGCEILIAAPEGQGHNYDTFLHALGIDPATKKPLDPLPQSPYKEQQYESAGWWFAQAILDTRGQPNRAQPKIKGHEDISPERKFDPGPLWDWERFQYWFDRYFSILKKNV